MSVMSVKTSAISATTTPMASIRHRKPLLQLPAQLLIFVIEIYMKNIRYAKRTIFSAKAMKRSRRRTSGIGVLARALAKMPLKTVAAMLNTTEMLPSTPVMREESMTKDKLTRTPW